MFTFSSRVGQANDSSLSHAMTPLQNILQGTMKCGQRRGRQRKRWMDNTKEWTFLPVPRTAHSGLLQKMPEERTSAESSVMFP